MTALMGSYKDFKDKFFHVRAAEHFPELFLGPNGARKFPLHWTLDPVPICGADRKLMSSEEQADVDVLERFSPLSCTKLLQLEHNTKGLQEYLVRMSPMSAEDLRVYFERASKSKRKASPEAAANDSSITHSSSSLIVRKVRKRCETEEDTVCVEIKGEQTQNSDDIEEKWRSILKDFDGLGQGEIKSLLDKWFPLPDLTDVSLVSLCRAIQAFAVRSALLAQTMEDEFDRAERDKVKMEKELERLMKKVAELEEEKSQWVAREKNLKAEKEKIENEKTEAVSALKAEKEKIENEKTKATKAVSALKAEKEKIENEKTKAVSALLTARKEAEKKIGMKDFQFEELKMEIALQYVAGFEKVVEQISFLHPRLDMSKVGPFKVIRDGRLSDPPSNRP